MKYYMMFTSKLSSLAMGRPKLNRMLEKCVECERIDIAGATEYVAVLDEKEYKLTKQCVFIKEKITIYEMLACDYY